MSDSDLTLVDLLARSLRLFGPRDALGTKGPRHFEWISYRQLGSLVDRAAAGLAARGVGPGDRVAIIANNRVEWAVLAFATHTLGAVFVPMYEAQAESEWEFILRDAGATLVACAGAERVATLRKLQERLPQLAHVIALDAPTAGSTAAGSTGAPSGDTYAALLDGGPTSPRVGATVRPSDLATLVYTSGTTGDPKGVMLSHGNILSNVLGASQRFDFGPTDRSLAFLPWAHAFGQTAELYTLLYVGASMAINDEIPRLTENLARIHPTILIAVPRIFNRLYASVQQNLLGKPRALRELVQLAVRGKSKVRRAESPNLAERLAFPLIDRLVFSKVRERLGGRLRFVVSGSAALDPQVAEFIDALGIDVFEGYGLSEASPVVSANYPGHHKIGTVGPPFPGVTVRIDRSSVLGTDEASATQGEIVVYGPGVMQGYHGRPDETAEVLTPDGGLHTGDMGYLDADGFLHITGRIKEQYKLENGKYVVPSPLEERLKLSPFIASVMIYGDNKPYNVVLVVPDRAAVQAWAAQTGRALGPLDQDPAVLDLLTREVEAHSEHFKSYEKPRAIAISSDDFTQENGMLTPKLSLRRRSVLAAHGARIEALYATPPQKASRAGTDS